MDFDLSSPLSSTTLNTFHYLGGMERRNCRIIESVSQEDVIRLDKSRFNTNNHWTDNKRPDDYDDIVKRVKTSDWIDIFAPTHQTFEFDENDVRWMKQANEICSITGKFSHLFDDEMQATVDKYKDVCGALFDKVHIRAEHVSLKYGKHGIIPYTNLKDVIESLVSSTTGHCPLKNADTHLKLYLIPWQIINPCCEFRVFVHKNKITAISQQELYTINTAVNDLRIHKWIDIITDYFNTAIKPKFTEIQNYSIDIAILDNGNTPYFIEVNSFGKEYAAGSALFHWLIDEEILYGNGETVHFRWTCS